MENMAVSKRKNHSGAFSAKVAPAALRGEKTLSKLSSKYDVHPRLATKWKRYAIVGLEDIFSSKWNKTPFLIS